MTTIIKWNISQLDCVPQEDGKADVVLTAHWQCTAMSGEYGNYPLYTSQVYGTSTFKLEQGANFTPYNQLTKDQVLGWCYANGINKDDIEKNVAAQLEAQINPPIVTPPLPWAPVQPA